MITSIIEGPYFVKSALLGTGLSYGKTSGASLIDFEPIIYDNFSGESINSDIYDRMMKVCKNLAVLPGGGHNKFLEMITMTLDITAPRFWWSEFDTYRVGVTKLSESTMHNLLHKQITNYDFEEQIPQMIIDHLNNLRLLCGSKNDIATMKNALPDGYLQRRIVGINAKCLKNIYEQRKNHRLPQWKMFIKDLGYDFDCTEEGRLVKEMIFEDFNTIFPVEK